MPENISVRCNISSLVAASDGGGRRVVIGVVVSVVGVGEYDVRKGFDGFDGFMVDGRAGDKEVVWDKGRWLVMGGLGMVREGQ